MGFIIWTVILTSLKVVVTLAQEKCSMNSNCTDNQYCYEESKICVNYVLCSQYNRSEALQPSREMSQCGDCLEGYVVEKTLGENGVDEICTAAEEKDSSMWVRETVKAIVAGSIAVAGTLYAIHAAFGCKSPCEDESAVELESTSSSMVENASSSTALLSSHSNENISESSCNDTEGTNLLIPTTRESSCNFTIIEVNQPCTVRGFYLNPTANPGDNQTAGTLLSPFNSNEQTVPREQIPSLSVQNTPMLPSVAIAPESVDDNRVNTAIHRLADPSLSANHQTQEIEQNNYNSERNSGGFEYNERNAETGI